MTMKLMFAVLLARDDAELEAAMDAYCDQEWTDPDEDRAVAIHYRQHEAQREAYRARVEEEQLNSVKFDAAMAQFRAQVAERDLSLSLGKT